MKSNLPPFNQRTARDVSRDRIEMLAVPIYPTLADHRAIWPELPHLTYELLIRGLTAQLAEQPKHVVAVLKETCAAAYCAWLRTHCLSHTEANFMRYWCFAPALRDPILLTRLDAGPAPIPISFRHLCQGEPDPLLVAQVEELVVRTMVEDDVTDPINTLACVFAAAAQPRSDSARDALHVVAEKVADGLPPELGIKAVDWALRLSAEPRRAFCDRNWLPPPM